MKYWNIQETIALPYSDVIFIEAVILINTSIYQYSTDKIGIYCSKSNGNTLYKENIKP